MDKVCSFCLPWHCQSPEMQSSAVSCFWFAERLLCSIILFYPKIILVHWCFVAEEKVDRR